MNHIRQGQNNSKRSRGRGRKPQGSNNNRTYDSNGPDVKIRGTATHVCEKYQQLARDAVTSGDRVMAENYYQHAEHYYRLLMAVQSADGQPRPQNNLGYRPDDDRDEDDDDNYETQGAQQPAYQPAQPQPASPQGGNGHEAQPRMIGEGDEGGEEQPNAGGNPANQNPDGTRRRQGRRRRPRPDQASGGSSEPAFSGNNDGGGGDAPSALPSESAPVVPSES